MIEDRWTQLSQNTALQTEIQKSGKPKPPKTKPVCVLDLNGVLTEKDITPKLNALYKEKIKLMFDPLTRKSETEVNQLLEQKGLHVQSKSNAPLAQQLRDFAADTCFEPAKGTAARQIAYDLAESAFDSKEITPTVYPDALTFCTKAAKNRRLAVLSRGTKSLLSKMVSSSTLSPFIAQTESTIPFGNAKTAETFIHYYLHVRTIGEQIAEILEDEFDAVSELVLASAWLSKQFPTRKPAIRIIWVDRDNELAQRTAGYNQLNQWISHQGFLAHEMLTRIETLEQLDLDE